MVYVLRRERFSSSEEISTKMKMKTYGSDFSDLVSEILLVRDGSRELSSLGETGTEETRDLLDENFGSKESVVLLGELLDELLVLVELLQILDRHVLELDKLGTIDIGSISENANRHARTGDVGEPVVNRSVRSESLYHLLPPIR